MQNRVGPGRPIKRCARWNTGIQDDGDVEYQEWKWPGLCVETVE